MAFEYEEVEVDEDPIMGVRLLSILTGVPVQSLMKEQERLQSSKEFWSDTCWIKPPSK